MSTKLLTVGVVVMVALAGCSALPGGGGADGEGTEGVDVENDDPGATDVDYSVAIRVDDETEGTELTAIGVTYPREAFAVDAAQHEDIEVGVDTDGDGAIEEEFDESHVSGVNNNAYSFDVTLDTDYTLEAGDVVVVEYPAVDNPDEAGDYTVEVRLNDRQTANATVTVE